MPSYNKVLLMGNLTRDVELRHLQSGTTVGAFGLAVNRRYKGGDGQTKEDVLFVDCEAWGNTAENLAKYLSKGRPVFVEGRLKLDEWQDKDGARRSKIKVVVESFQFVDSKPEEERPAGAGGGATNASAARPATGSGDEIPF